MDGEDERDYLEEKLRAKNRKPGQENWPQKWIDYDKYWGNDSEQDDDKHLPTV